LKNKLVVSSLEIVLAQGTLIATNERKRSVMKSMEREAHGPLGIESG
jgi:hypothetical protein